MASNLQNQPIDYRITDTTYFRVKSYVYPHGASFTEYTSHGRWGSLPLLHVTLGKDPATGRRKTAYGVVGIGAISIGIFSVGMLAIGVVALGWVSVGLLFAFGQASLAINAVGQLAVGIQLAIGQIAVGYVAIGQIAVGYYALGQVALGPYPYSSQFQSYPAWEFFRQYLPWLPEPDR